MFSAVNGAAATRTETIRVSIPFAVGTQTVAGLADKVVTGFSTAWLPLQVWGDGSAKVAQAQFTDTLTSTQTKNYDVGAGTALSAAFSRHAWVESLIGTLELGAEVTDIFDVAYRATLVASAAGETVQSTSLVRVKRHRVYHEAAAGGIGRDFLTSTFYVTEFRDVPVVIVDWVLGNDYLGADAPAGSPDKNLYPLGHVDVNDAHFLIKGATTVASYRAAKEGIGASEAMSGSFTGYRVLTDDWIGDGQTRRYRFLVGLTPGGADPGEAAAALATLTAMQTNPLFPLATQAAWQDSEAAGLVGGPITGPATAAADAATELASWEGGGDFGLWGAHGDTKDTNTGGTIRNGPLSQSFAHAIQGQHQPLLAKLEGMAWIQAARAYHLYDLELGDENKVVLWEGMPYLPGLVGVGVPETLGRKALNDSDPYPTYRTRVLVGDPPAIAPVGGDPHDWQGYDHEHYTCDLLFDWWTVSGDAWAKEELRQLGQSMKGLMKDLDVGAFTSNMQAVRAEGWCIWGMVQSSQATGDAGLKTYYMQRITQIIDVDNHFADPGEAMAWQANHPATTFPIPPEGTHEFYMAWQHGAVLFGFLGAYIHWGDAILLEIAEHVATTVEHSWVTNVTQAPFGFIANGIRHYTPTMHDGSPVAANYFDATHGIRFGDSPLPGSSSICIAGLLHLSNHSANPTIVAKAVTYGELLRGPVESMDRGDVWNYCIPASYGEGGGGGGSGQPTRSRLHGIPHSARFRRGIF
jgi:hypothetical protein